MPVGQNIISRKYFSQNVNGEDFSLNTTDFTFNLAANVGDRVKAEYEVEVFWYAQATSSSAFNINGNTITRQSGSFITDGFVVGDTIDAGDFPVGIPSYVFQNRLVTSVTDTQLIFNGAPIGNSNYNNLWIWGKTPLTALDFRFGIIENSEAFNTVSKIEGSNQAYAAGGIGTGTWGSRSTTPVTLTSLGNYNSWRIGPTNNPPSVVCTFVSDTSALFPTPYTQRLKIEHEFTVPYYLDGDLSNIQNGLETSILQGNQSYKYVFDANFRQVLSNPNSGRSVRENTQLGSVGGYGENFNGFQNQFSGTVSYTGTNNVNAVGTTSFAVIVNSANASFVGGIPFILNISYLPDDFGDVNDVGPNSNLFGDNFLLDSIYQEQGASAKDSTILEDVQTGLFSAGAMQITGTINYTALQSLKLDASKNYILWVSIQDPALSNADSDRVSLILDTQTYNFDADVQGLFSVTEHFIYEHNSLLNGFTDYKGWVEDGVYFTFDFETDLSLDAKFRFLRCGWGAYNSTDDEFFEISAYNYDLSGIVETQQTVAAQLRTVQNISFSGTRGFQLASGDEFNEVTLEFNGINGNFAEYSSTIGLKIPYMDWESLPAADTVFYDSTLPNNGLNKKASNYSGINNYEVVIFIEAGMTNGSGTTLYRTITPPITCNDYAEDGNVTPEWVITWETFDQSGNDLAGAILNSDDSENTDFKATCTYISPPPSIGDEYGVPKLELSQSGPFGINELSTIRAFPSNDPLQPLTGDTQARITVTATGVEIEGQIDHTQITPGAAYKLSTRLGGTG